MPTRTPESFARDHLSKVLIAIARNSRKRGLLSGVAASVRRLFSQDRNETKDLLSKWGPRGLLIVLPGITKSAWTDRWREAMRPVFSDIVSVFDEELAKKSGIDPAFDLQSPFLNQVLDGWSLELAQRVNDTTRGRIEKEIRDGLFQGQSNADIAARIEGVFKTSTRARAQTIARTETHRAHSTATHLQALASGVVTRKEWLATKDSRTRPEHRKLNGEVVGLTQPFSNGEMFPGEHSINCRCSALYLP